MGQTALRTQMEANVALRLLASKLPSEEAGSPFNVVPRNESVLTVVVQQGGLEFVLIFHLFPLLCILCHRGAVSAISVHPSGKMALSVGRDKTLRTWNLMTGKAAYITNIKQGGSYSG